MFLFFLVYAGDMVQQGVLNFCNLISVIDSFYLNHAISAVHLRG